jgi:LmbE family N-acetylglucosaminyl deacetylase
MKVENKRVLAVGAHPDDVEFMCSGTLKLLKDKGWDISIGVIANGDCGSMVENSESITRIRRHEAINAAKLLDAEFYPLGELDFGISFDDHTKAKATELIRMVDPQVVFTHPHEDYMVDHEMTSRLIRMACFSAPVPNYFTRAAMPSPRTYNSPYLYYWSPLDGKDIYGNFVPQSIHVEISGVVDFKAELLNCHKSQRDWLLEQHGIDAYIEMMKTTGKLYGDNCGFEYAEGFTQHLGNAYPQENILKSVLGKFVKEDVNKKHIREVKHENP